MTRLCPFKFNQLGSFSLCNNNYRTTIVFVAVKKPTCKISPSFVHARPISNEFHSLIGIKNQHIRSSFAEIVSSASFKKGNSYSYETSVIVRSHNMNQNGDFSGGHFTSFEYCHTSAHPKIFNN